MVGSDVYEKIKLEIILLSVWIKYLNFFGVHFSTKT